METFFSNGAMLFEIFSQALYFIHATQTGKLTYQFIIDLRPSLSLFKELQVSGFFIVLKQGFAI